MARISSFFGICVLILTSARVLGGKITHGVLCTDKSGCTCSGSGVKGIANCAKDETCMFSEVAWCAKSVLNLSGRCLDEGCVCGTQSHIADGQHKICYFGQFCDSYSKDKKKFPVCLNEVSNGETCQDRNSCVCRLKIEGELTEMDYVDYNERGNAQLSPFETMTEANDLPVLTNKQICEYSKGCLCDATDIFPLDASKTKKCNHNDMCIVTKSGQPACYPPVLEGELSDKMFVCAPKDYDFFGAKSQVCFVGDMCGFNVNSPVCFKLEEDKAPTQTLVTDKFGRFEAGVVPKPGAKNSEEDFDVVSGFCLPNETVTVKNNKLFCVGSKTKIMIAEDEVCPSRVGGCECFVGESQETCKGGQKCAKNGKGKASCVKYYDYFTCEGEGSWKWDGKKTCDGDVLCQRSDSGEKGEIVKASTRKAGAKTMDRKEVIKITMGIMRKRGFRLPVVKNRVRNLGTEISGTVVSAHPVI